MTARCITCGDRFQRAANEQWKTRCYSCWLELRRRQEQQLPIGPSPLEREFAEHLRALTQLCHPDRHDGSPLANEVTSWLLRMRRELRP